MKKHINLVTVIAVALVIASLLGHAKGITFPGLKTFGFSSGG
jgi:hypothetical protein